MRRIMLLVVGGTLQVKEHLPIIRIGLVVLNAIKKPLINQLTVVATLTEVFGMAALHITEKRYSRSLFLGFCSATTPCIIVLEIVSKLYPGNSSITYLRFDDSHH